MTKAMANHSAVSVRQVKCCNVCGETKPLSAFHKFKRAPDGRQYRCKPCNKGLQRKYARQKGVSEKRQRDPSLLKKGLKECFRCDEVKLLSDFSPTKRGIGGVASYCKPCMSGYQLEYRKNDPEFVEKLREYRQRPLWKALHRGQTRRRNARKRKLDTGRVTTAFVKQLYEEECCYYCNEEVPFDKRTMEHKTPLSRGGLHDPSNLAMACARCNSSKRAMTEEEYREKLNVVCS